MLIDITWSDIVDGNIEIASVMENMTFVHLLGPHINHFTILQATD